MRTGNTGNLSEKNCISIHGFEKTLRTISQYYLTKAAAHTQRAIFLHHLKRFEKRQDQYDSIEGNYHCGLDGRNCEKARKEGRKY